MSFKLRLEASCFRVTWDILLKYHLKSLRNHKCQQSCPEDSWANCVSTFTIPEQAYLCCHLWEISGHHQKDRWCCQCGSYLINKYSPCERLDCKRSVDQCQLNSQYLGIWGMKEGNRDWVFLVLYHFRLVFPGRMSLEGYLACNLDFLLLSGSGSLLA